MTALLVANGMGIPGRLQPTELQLAGGSLTALIGPNGGGKTSLLRALAGIDRSGGAVRVGGEDLARASPSRRRQLLSFLPAARDVPWPIAARDVIALGLSRPDPLRVQELLDELGLAPLAARPVDRVSTGERARVLLGRALAPCPAVLLLDEPLSNLDPYWVLRTVAILRHVAGGGAAVLVAVHDLTLLDHFDRALLVDGGEVLADAEPGAVVADPAFELAFRVRAGPNGWRISPEAGPRSSR